VPLRSRPRGQPASGEFEAAVLQTADLKTKGLDIMKSIGMSQSPHHSRVIATVLQTGSAEPSTE
jgi:hypothetical protein